MKNINIKLNGGENNMEFNKIILLNSNDLVILSSIVDKTNNLGMCEARGITKTLLSEKTNLSLSTVNRCINKLVKLGYVGNAIKQVRKNSYYLTKKGYEKLNETL